MKGTLLDAGLANDSLLPVAISLRFPYDFLTGPLALRV